jgi:dipeptide/tripeptide permease
MQKLQVEEPHDYAKPGNKFPKCVFLIILNEFCERFSYYGLKTILIIYFTQFLLLNDNTATAIYHAFSMLCYFTPVLGAILADAYFGQYKTIVSLSIVYLIGELVLTLTALKPLGAPNIPGPMVGLLLIALGTGGIKPCVAAFGANQFSSDQNQYLDKFFSMFYFSINAGSLISTIITPILRNDVKCFNNDCYPIAFGVPAALMLVAIVVFLCGTPSYKHQPKKNENLFANVYKCIMYAFIMKIKRRKDKLKTKPRSWLDYSKEKFDQKFVNDVKVLLKVLCVFIPVPIFWALFDQQGSRWTLQAQKLNTYLTADKSYSLKPDQIQAINPILILIFIPVFDWAVYPLLAKFNMLKKPLSRMTVGMLFGSLAFVSSALLEHEIQKSYKYHNVHQNIELINLSPCHVHLTIGMTSAELKPNERFLNPYGDSNNLTYACSNSSETNQVQIISNTNEFKNYYVFYEQVNANGSRSLNAINFQSSIVSQPIGKAEVRFFTIASDDGHFEASLRTSKISYQLRFENFTNNPYAGYNKLYFDKYDLSIDDVNGTSTSLNASYNLLNGARYTFVHYNDAITQSPALLQLNDLHEYEISIFYQLLQYIILSAGEIMFSISGLAFAYSEAPQTMKSILQAAWLITVAFGNLIVVIVAEAQLINDQFYEYLLFAALLAITMIVFGIIAFFYKYVDQSADKSAVEEKYCEEPDIQRF